MTTRLDARLALPTKFAVHDQALVHESRNIDSANDATQENIPNLPAYTKDSPTNETPSAPNPVIENYLPPSMLTGIPRPIDSVDIASVGFSLDKMLGEIELMLLISSEGRIDDVLVLHSSLPEPLVDSAKSAFMNARFTPGRINETAVRSRVRVVVSPTVLDSDSELTRPAGTKVLR